MNKDEIIKDIQKLRQQRNFLTQQLQGVQQQVDLIQTNVMRTDGAIAFLNDKLKELEKKKMEKKEVKK